MLLTQDEMIDVAEAIAKDTPISSLIDTYADNLRLSPDVDVSDMSDQELRSKLSNEINRANPRSVRFAPTKYGHIHENYTAARTEAFATFHEERRIQFEESVSEYRKLLEQGMYAMFKAALGQKDTIEPAEPGKEQVDFLVTAFKIGKDYVNACHLESELTKNPDGGFDNVLPAPKL